MTRFEKVLITGASSGIGAALAQACARPGAVLHLSGRDEGRLASVAEACRARGATALARTIDVRDAGVMAAWIEGAGRLDAVIANAGISSGADEDWLAAPDRIRAIVETNITGVLNTALPALRVMTAQTPGADGWRGRIGVVASIAAFVPAPGAAAYCASKAAADTWTVATARSARARGIALSSVCPGFVGSAMTPAISSGCRA